MSSLKFLLTGTEKRNQVRRLLETGAARLEARDRKKVRKAEGEKDRSQMSEVGGRRAES